MSAVSRVLIPARYPLRTFRCLRMRFRSVEVSDEPHLEADALAGYAAALEGAHAMIEYGSGGSTIFAARRGVAVSSAETSRRFSEAVNRRLEEIGASTSSVTYCDVGPTERWGWPVDTTPTTRNLLAWQQYVEAPWRAAPVHGRRPDLVLVDGRFRVACVAYSALQIGRNGSNAPILLDDAQRNEYRAIDLVCEVAQRFGRMEQLRVRADVTAASMEALLLKHLSDPR